MRNHGKLLNSRAMPVTVPSALLAVLAFWPLRLGFHLFDGLIL
jgi:hypothetical protein